MAVVVYNCTSRRGLGTYPVTSLLSFHTGSSILNGGPDTSMLSVIPGTAKGLLGRCDYAVCGGDADKWSTSFTDPTQFSKTNQPTSVANGKNISTWVAPTITMNNFNGV